MNPTHKELMEHWLAGGVTQRPYGNTARMRNDGSVRYDDDNVTAGISGKWELLPLSPWIEWNATADSECPVPYGTRGNIRFRGAREAPDRALSGFDWNEMGYATIVAYQVTHMPRPEVGRKVMITHSSGHEVGPYPVNEHGISWWTWVGYEQYTTNGAWRGWKYVPEKRLMTREEAMEFILDHQSTMLVRRNDSGPWCLPGAIIYPNDMFGFEYTLRDGNGERTEPRRFETEDV